MVPVLILYFLVGMIGLFLGLLGGWVVKDARIRNAFGLAVVSLVRVTKKKWLRNTNPGFDLSRVQRDDDFLSLPIDKRYDLVDYRAIDVAAEMKLRLSFRFKEQIEALYVFGSRVRGDFQPDSDVDIGIFLRNHTCSDFLLKKEILFCSGELLFKYGLFLQPRIFNPVDPDDNFESPENYLRDLVISYGVLV